MRNWTLFLATIYLLSVFSCAKDTPASNLVGKWVLSKYCVCNSCTNASPTGNHQTLIFKANGQVDLYGSVGDTEKHYSGIYAVTQQAGYNILNITLEAAAPKDFLYIPGAIIYAETKTNLVLNLSTPFGNPCLYQNTYVSTPQ